MGTCPPTMKPPWQLHLAKGRQCKWTVAAFVGHPQKMASLSAPPFFFLWPAAPPYTVPREDQARPGRSPALEEATEQATVEKPSFV